VTRALAAAAAALLLAAAPAAAADTPVAVLLYHHVSAADDDPLYVTPRLFRRHLAALDRAGYEAITLRRAWRAWEEDGRLPAKPVVLSFDDGYADQFRNAAKALRARRWPGVLFLQSARLDVDGGLSTAQVRRLLRQGWELGAHTVTHPDLRGLGNEGLAEEVGGSREALRRAFPSEPVDFFAYPFGRFDPVVVDAVRAAGFTGATTTRRGLAEPSDGAFTLDRQVITGGFTPKRLLRGIRGATSHRR
jgi:peptidoglycan/xylan/chitin deacetylase (PgdA/CDA1 family)